ncbi:Xaa-Pro peptidase family protein [Psychrilyobacter sp.]|uniref:M24 family metallopeptidase n=1 Tax=Psychrilyobacter sp. TaxID=2586924 RepID=UPI00301A3068
MKLKKLMEEKKIDGILITDLVNLRYFTGFTGSTGIALSTKKGKYFLVDFRYVAQANDEVAPTGFEVVVIERPATNKINEILKEENIKRLGIEDQNVSLAEYNGYIEKFEGLEFVPLGDSFTRIRMVKTEAEIKNIRKAADIADKAFAKILPLIKEGAVENDIKTELEYEMKKLGAEGPSFDTIIASNYRSAMPHGVASKKKIDRNGFIKFDFGCFYKGYASDMTRTVYFGDQPSEKHLEIYNTVLEAQLKAIDEVKVGMSTRELDKIARDHITSKGYGENFGHGLGHGIGLEIHELPNVSRKAEDFILEENMVITIEPGIYIDGFGGVRIEDDVVVKKDGYEILNNTTKELIIIK